MVYTHVKDIELFLRQVDAFSERPEVIKTTNTKIMTLNHVLKTVSSRNSVTNDNTLTFCKKNLW